MMVRAAEYIQLLVRVGGVYHRENVYSREIYIRESTGLTQESAVF